MTQGAGMVPMAEVIPVTRRKKQNYEKINKRDAGRQ